MGRPLTSRARIEEIAVTFYTNLYRSTMPVTHTYTYAGRGLTDRRMGGATRLASNKAGKTPGPDRISADFQKWASRTVIK
ncbi:hypothetical protein COOONC_00219 [Cooperia oncophora]